MRRRQKVVRGCFRRLISENSLVPAANASRIVESISINSSTLSSYPFMASLLLFKDITPCYSRSTIQCAMLKVQSNTINVG